MFKVISRRIFLGGLLSAMASGAALANAPKRSLRPMLRPRSAKVSSAPDVRELIRSANVSGKVSFAVADMQGGNLLESHEPETALPPASVSKTLTALYALEFLGPAHRFETRILATGPVVDGVLAGDLILAGGGDPTLDTDGLASLVAELKAMGLRLVKGRFHVFGGALPYVSSIDPGQPDSAGYSPSVSGLSLNFNRVHFEWKRSGSGYTTTMDARSRKYFPAVSVIAMKVGARDYPVYTYAQNGKKEVWNVARGALGKGGARWLPVRKPELYAGDVFRTLASAQGIKMKPAKKMSRLPQSYRLLARYQSVPLAPMLKSMLKYSNNLTAEMVGMAATKARGKAAAGMRNSASAMSAWARDSLGMKHTKLVDHSGLGGGSRMCAGELARALADPVRRDRLEPLLKDIALRDPKGKPLKNHPVKVRAKTGTLNFVSGLAGYVNGPGGQDLAFAIFAADEPARGKIKRADRIRPKGARGWNRRAKSLQQKLIERWHRTFDV